jgi:hypothetical protein
MNPADQGPLSVLGTQSSESIATLSSERLKKHVANLMRGAKLKHVTPFKDFATMDAESLPGVRLSLLSFRILLF